MYHQKRIRINELKGYHGTSYNFDKFNHKKYLDTGDGSQEFGWGTYVTDNAEIGSEYADRSRESNTGMYDKNDERVTAEKLSKIAGKTIKNDILAKEIVDSLRTHMYTNKVFDSNTLNKKLSIFSRKYPNDTEDITNFIKSVHELESTFKKANSFLYEVEIPDVNNENYIQWFANLEDDFIDRLKDGLLRLEKRFNGVTESVFKSISDCKTNGEVYKKMVEIFGSQKSVSLFLLNLCGYKGIVYPIGTVFGFDGESGNNYVIFNANDVKIIGKTITENINMNLNEWKPDFFDGLPEKIKLYHGTDVMAINDIIESGIICAKNGRKRSETYGVNWFSTKLTDNFGHGSNFSIEVPKQDFIDCKFNFMNNSEVTSEMSEIPISEYNFRIERIGGFKENTFKKIFERVNGDVFDFVEYLNMHNHEFNEYMFTVDYPVVMYLIRQLFGEEPLRKEGIIESKVYVNEVKSEDVSLSSFTTKDSLHEKFWINNKLNSRVREKLLNIADDFIDELSLDNFKPKDIVFTGSLANYNWSRYSDIDLHIVVSFKSIYKNVELIDDYFKSKKEIWKQAHEGLKIYGYPVEISVENSDEPGVSSGVYSVSRNKWIVKPSNFDDAKLNEKYIKSFSADIMTEIDNIEKKIKTEKSYDKLEKLADKAMAIFKKLKNKRKESLARSGEMASGNICWKIIRRTGYLDKIWDIINNTYNKINSLR